MSHHRTPRHGGSGLPEKLARGLGWFSLALGAVEILAPGTIRRNTGLPGPRHLPQAYGLREIAAGVAILASEHPVRMVWGRVAGDVLDIATLLPALRASNPQRAGATAAMGFLLAATALDLAVALQGDRNVTGRRGAGRRAKSWDHVQLPLDKQARAPDTQDETGAHEIAPDLAYRRLGIVNAVFFGAPGSADWVLIDTGIPGSKSDIMAVAEKRFGKGVPPRAILLTHGHFDHIGTVQDLSQEWGVDVYAHPLEHPFLDGSQSYPPPDTAAGGGIMPRLAPLFPRSPIDLGAALKPLPENGTVPFMPGWRWIATPGHTPGHVSLWREADRTLIAGDAFVTTGQEALYEVMTQRLEMHGPPRYFTPDWASADRSVTALAHLEPELVVTGHGRALKGPTMRAALHDLAAHFTEIAVPEHAR